MRAHVVCHIPHAGSRAPGSRRKQSELMLSMGQLRKDSGELAMWQPLPCTHALDPQDAGGTRAACRRPQCTTIFPDADVQFLPTTAFLNRLSGAEQDIDKAVSESVRVSPHQRENLCECQSENEGKSESESGGTWLHSRESGSASGGEGRATKRPLEKTTGEIRGTYRHKRRASDDSAEKGLHSREEKREEPAMRDDGTCAARSRRDRHAVTYTEEGSEESYEEEAPEDGGNTQHTTRGGGSQKEHAHLCRNRQSRHTVPRRN